jgi:hypothetical protein
VGHLVPALFILFAAEGAIVHLLSLVTLIALPICFTLAQAGPH